MGVGRSARIHAVGRSAIKLCDFGKVISCPWAAVTGRDGVVTFEVTFNDYHLEHWGSKRDSLRGWGNAGLVGGGEPHGAVQTVRRGRER